MKKNSRKGHHMSYEKFEIMIWETRCLSRNYDLMTDFEKKFLRKFLEESEVADNFSKASAAEAERDFKKEIEADFRRMEQDFWG